MLLQREQTAPWSKEKAAALTRSSFGASPCRQTDGQRTVPLKLSSLASQQKRPLRSFAATHRLLVGGEAESSHSAHSPAMGMDASSFNTRWDRETQQFLVPD